ncbi:MAG: hypothetical protein KAQ68_05190 [Clostridiales bacterium]|nr:hypothetical protein [Clostridiales bacterium]
MITIIQRQKYFNIIGYVFFIGVFLYTIIAITAKIEYWYLLILAGGYALASIGSGIMIVGRFIINRKITLLTVSSIVLFPITWVITCLIGIFSLIPYFIYNFKVLKKMKTAETIYEINEYIAKARILVWIGSAFLVLVFFSWPIIFGMQSDADEISAFDLNEGNYI